MNNSIAFDSLKVVYWLWRKKTTCVSL